MMKAFLISLSALFAAQVSYGQSNGVHAKVSFVDSVIKSKKSHESGFRITVFNDTDRNLYLPNLLNTFKQQITDSLLISKLQDGKYMVISRETGEGNSVSGIRGITSYLDNQYFARFKKKKSFADSIAGTTAELRGKRSINALFLKAGERFTLYQTSPVFWFGEPGDYRIDFKIRKRGSANFPAEIAGFQLFESKVIAVEPLFISVRALRKGSRAVLKDSKGKVIRSLIWPGAYLLQ